MKNSGAQDLLATQESSTRVLAGLYRSTFVEKMQEHFQSMLTGAYTIYVTALKEGFDPTLRAHLADVLQDLVARASELADVFQDELMRDFWSMVEQTNNSDVTDLRSRERQSKLFYRVDNDAEVQEFVARTIRSIETSHGSMILALTKTYVKLVNQPVEDFRPPWTPAKLFSVFGVVLQQIEVPVHGRIKLALYKMFSQEVLRHFGDACLAFRDALPETPKDLKLPHSERVSPAATPLYIKEVSPAASSFRLAATSESDVDALESILASAERDSLNPASNVPDQSGQEDDKSLEKEIGTNAEPQMMRFVRFGFVLLSSLVVIGGGWWLGTHFAKTRLNPDETAAAPAMAQTRAPDAILPKPPAEAPPLPETSQFPEQSPAKETPWPPSAQSPSSEVGGSPPAQSLPTPREVPPSSQVKREAMLGVKLRHFAWRVDPDRSEMLFDLTILNTNKVRIDEIEVVCSQYSGTLDFLEAAKTVLAESIEPVQTRTFKAVPIGFKSKQVKRVNCVIADLKIAGAQ
jgi:hypothetical protein